MFEDHDHEIREILRKSDLFPTEHLETWSDEATRQRTGLADHLLQTGCLKEADLLQALAQHLETEYLSETPERLPEPLVSLLDPDLARNYGVVPLRAEGSSIDLLAIDPLNRHLVDDLTFRLNRDIRLIVTHPEYVRQLLAIHYGNTTLSLEDLLGELQQSADADAPGQELEELSNAASDGPVVRFVHLVLSQAIRQKASDVHFEPFADQFRIRYRVDGSLEEMPSPPLRLAGPVTARIKVMADLNIAERRIPQDGRIKMTLSGRAVDLRVSTLPTQFGESVVLRVLDKGIVNLDLDRLGMPPDVLAGTRAAVRRPNGIFIVTGPTGSGKTTTLYSALREVNEPDCKILTAEDPVEYEIEGIVQIAVHASIGLTFASALRAFLRQDPDKIMVGEIRDLETAQIAVQASLTGHLVLSTLHTNDAAGAVTRLIDMGLEPYLIAASLDTVLAQRLLRRICQDCRREYQADLQLAAQLGFAPEDCQDLSFFAGTGCPACAHSGLRGRLGLFEMIRLHGEMRELVTNRASTLEIRRAAIAQGMRTLRAEGRKAIRQGIVTPAEVLKYT